MKSIRFSMLMVALAAICLPLLYTNCGKAVEFGMTHEAQMEAKGIYSFATSFDANSSSSVPIDVIWVIDNSGSMANEAAHVRSNFLSFASELEASTNFKFALISRVGTTGTFVTLPKTGERYKQFDKMVGSTDGLIIASKAICPAGQTCGSVVGTGELASFVRADSKKVFIVVTDDESQMTAANFVSSFTSRFNVDQLRVFGFIGLANASCSISRVGEVYRTLAKSHGGDTYDICQSNWSSTFRTLADNMIAISRNQIALPTSYGPIKELLEVYLNGVLLSPSAYRLDGQNLVFLGSVLNGITKANVQVVYQVERD